MSDIEDPSNNAEKAAMQIVVELIRAERVSMHHNNVDGLLSIYDQALEHFKNTNNGKSDS
ncbi:TPA: ATP-NAD kinase [Serratia liquefaciens]|nr:ATP-NAD kinase [Serratia liquefaciens]